MGLTSGRHRLWMGGRRIACFRSQSDGASDYGRWQPANRRGRMHVIHAEGSPPFMGSSKRSTEGTPSEQSHSALERTVGIDSTLQALLTLIEVVDATILGAKKCESKCTEGTVQVRRLISHIVPTQRKLPVYLSLFLSSTSRAGKTLTLTLISRLAHLPIHPPALRWSLPTSLSPPLSPAASHSPSQRHSSAHFYIS